MTATVPDNRAGAADYPLGRGWREFLVVAAICAALLGLLYARTYRVARTDALFLEPWDHHKYIYMALHNPVDFHIAPFCWRFLNPLIAHFLPFDVDTNFLVITLSEIFLVGVLIYCTLRKWGFRQYYALAGVIFFMGIPEAVRGPIGMVWHVDQVTWLFIIATIYLLLIKQPVWASLALAAGIAGKDVVILGAPLYYLLYADRIVDRDKLWRGVLFALPAAIAFMAIRKFIPEMGSDPAYAATLPSNVAQSYNGQPGFGYLESLKVVIGWKIAEFSGWQLRAITVNAFGMLFLFPFFAWRENWMPFVRWSPFIALTYFSMLFSGSYERVLLVCFPAVLILALNGLDHLRRIAGVGDGWVLGLACALFPINLLYPKRIEPFFEVQALIFIVFLAAMLQWRPGGLKAVPPSA
jgi:hypothetical protein